MEIQTHGLEILSEGMVVAHLKLLTPYKNTLHDAFEDTAYSVAESSLHAPFDEEVVEDVKKRCEPFKGKVKVVLLAGIGGSNLGTCALYDALRGYAQKVTKVDAPQLLTFDTTEPQILEKMEALLGNYDTAEEVVLIVVSKSGATTETLANANVLFSLFVKRFGKGSATKQTFVITDENTPLAEKAKGEGMHFFALPSKVGGRFSVFTTVGLVPLTLLGFDIDTLLEGARQGVQASCTKNKPSSAAVIASFLFEAYLQGARIHELFIWNPELETLGKWYRQLLAESIGKERPDGTQIGITPTIAIGSTDLHSVGQLIFGGRNDRFTTFVSVPSTWNQGQKLDMDSIFTSPVLENKESNTVPKAIYAGVQTAYINHKLPFVSIELSAVSERELGAFMTLHMAVIMYLAQLFDVNAFDQPAVETYKKEVYRLLTSYK
jgi:glucose-6-phosphate isomerase